MIELVKFTKNDGPLTKRIFLGADGKPVSDGSACVMGSGTAERIMVANPQALADEIAGLGSDKALGLGRLRADLPDKVAITTKARLNGSASNTNIISRTREYIDFAPGQPAVMLVDIDYKGMPTAVRDRVKSVGGPFAALASVEPRLNDCGCVIRSSTSTGLSNADTGEQYAGSEGLHIYVLVADGADIPRALQAWHDRCWLNGFGWSMLGANGAILERSLIDRTVYAPERLVFEGAPVLDPPLVQDQTVRAPWVRDGGPL